MDFRHSSIWVPSRLFRETSTSSLVVKKKWLVRRTFSALASKACDVRADFHHTHGQDSSHCLTLPSHPVAVRVSPIGSPRYWWSSLQHWGLKYTVQRDGCFKTYPKPQCHIHYSSLWFTCVKGITRHCLTILLINDAACLHVYHTLLEAKLIFRSHQQLIGCVYI